jgi:hypothetical protein
MGLGSRSLSCGCSRVFGLRVFRHAHATILFAGGEDIDYVANGVVTVDTGVGTNYRTAHRDSARTEPRCREARRSIAYNHTDVHGHHVILALSINAGVGKQAAPRRPMKVSRLWFRWCAAVDDSRHGVGRYGQNFEAQCRRHLH